MNLKIALMVVVLSVVLVLGIFIGRSWLAPSAVDLADADETAAGRDNNSHDDAADGDTKGQDDHPAEEGAPSVSLTTAQLSELGISLETAGSIRYTQPMRFSGEVKLNLDQQYQVTAPFQARVEQVHAQLGQYVTKGQPLATLWVPDLVDMQKQVEQSRAKLQLSQQEFQREQSLFQQGVTAQKDVQAADYNLKLAQIELNANLTQREAYQGALSAVNGRMVLRAPAAGMISQRYLSLGQMLSGGTPLYSISALQSAWIEFAVPTSQADHVQTGMSVQIKAEGQPAITGRVLQTGSQADPQTRQLLIRAQVDKPAAWLAPNLWVEVSVEGAPQGIEVAVPARAIQSLAGQSVVFVATSNTNAQGGYAFVPQAVTATLLEGSEWVQISTGLVAGQIYASGETFLLKSEIEKSEASHAH